ncbi:major facilitator superfamily domain-containing protein [Aspergillus stella-maris]|uniref:major facilitator superfamily domain-containing protein n=1 Tax=Aspergillus stella-maris TaxID=1810926 RepID=UPI003CCCA5C2
MVNDERVGWKITSRLQKGRLLAAVNCLAGLAIFFFEAIVTATLLQGGITSVYYLGTLVGCFIGGSVGDRFGRIKSFAIGTRWGIVVALLQCTAKTPSWIIVAQLVNGIGTGILNVIVPVYGSEVAEYQSRGQFIAMLGYGLSFIDGGSSEFQWRFPIAFQVVMLLVLLGGCWFFPESPRWLCTAGRREEAHYVLTRLRGAEDMVRVEREMDEIEAVIELERSTSKKATYFHMLFGLGSEDLHIARRRRRWTLWWGAAGQAMVYLYTFIFGATWLTIPWLYPAEIFPLMCRAKGNAWGVVGWSLGNGSLTLALPYVFDALGEKTMYVFGAVNVISIPIVWAFYPESSQRTLEEIDLLFAADSPWAWTAESNFQELRAVNRGLGLAKDVQAIDPEKALEANDGHLEVVDNRQHEL